MKTISHPAHERGYAKHGWLETHYSFSFASYFDPARMGFGALRVINDDIIAPGQGFGRHPHDNMEIITIPLSGALTHEDSMGNREVIATGEIQVMSAGTGVEHSEYNASKTEPVKLLQIWIFPNQTDVAPRYAEKKIDMSSVSNTFEEVVGEIGKSEVGIHQSAHLSLGRFDKDTEYSYSLASGQGLYLFVIEGEMQVGEIPLKKRDALGVWETEKVPLHIQKNSFILVIEVPMG